MTDNNYPITPPPELVQKIAGGPGTWLEKISKAYCAGADQELDACCEWLNFYAHDVDARDLRTARRPEPPSLKDQSLEALYRFGDTEGHESLEQFAEDFEIIRRALESLPD